MDDFFFSTGAIEKGRQHGLTNVTMSSSHVKKAIQKKSMTLKNVYMQLNTSFNPPIKKVKKDLEEVETSLFFMTVDILIT